MGVEEVAFYCWSGTMMLCIIITYYWLEKMLIPEQDTEQKGRF